MQEKIKKSHAIVIDIGGTNIKYGLLNENLEFRHLEKEKTQRKQIYRQVLKICQYLLDISQKIGNINQICICSAGIIDSNTKVVVNTNPIMKTYIGTDFKKLVTHFNLPVYILNDANAAAYATFHDKKDYVNGALVTFGTGVGVGLFLNKTLYAGHNNLGGEFGYLKFGEKRLDSYLSYSKFHHMMKNRFKLDDANLSTALMATTNKQAIDLVYKYLKKVAHFLAQISIILNLDEIEIGGGLSHLDSSFINYAFDEFYSYLKTTPFRTKIKIAKQKNHAGMIGAYLFAQNQAKIEKAEKAT